MTHQLMQFFEYKHLPERLQVVSEPFGKLAAFVDHNLPNNCEKTTALRKLLEAKDCAVRALLFREPAVAAPIENPDVGIR